MLIKHGLSGLASASVVDIYAGYHAPNGGEIPKLILDFENEVFARDNGSGLEAIARDTIISGFSAYETVGGIQRMRHNVGDAPNVSTSDFTFSASAGTVQVLGRYDEIASFDRFWQLDDGTTTDRMGTTINGAGDGRGFIEAGDVETANIDLNPYTSDTLLGIAFGWDSGDGRASMDGTTTQVDSSVTIPTGLTLLKIGYPNEPGGGTQKLVYWNTQLGDSDLEALSVNNVAP